MHIGGVMLFEPHSRGGAPPVARLREVASRSLPALPRFRQRLSSTRTHGLSWPTWVPDESFDVNRHVREAGLPQPGDEGALLEWAGEYYSQRLDRSRPLWELVVLELADGRWALATKTHHCMVDGVGSVDIGYTLLDLERNPPEPETPAEEDRPLEPSSGGSRLPAPLRFTVGAGRRAAGVASRTLGAVAGTAGMAKEAVVHPVDTTRRSRALAELLIRDELIAAPTCSLNDPISAHRRLGVISASLDELKAIKSELGGTVNDVVLASAAGGFRRLLEGRGEEPPDRGLRAMVPMNIRAAGERLALGNRITSLFVHLPVAEADPRRRYARQVEEAEALKSGTQAVGSHTMIDLAGHAPPLIHSFVARSLFATRLFNVTITNVPGPPDPLYALGSKLLSVWPIVPIAADHAVGIAVFSYDGQLFFCVNADRDSVPDLDVLTDGIRESIAELRELTAAQVP